MKSVGVCFKIKYRHVSGTPSTLNDYTFLRSWLNWEWSA